MEQPFIIVVKGVYHGHEADVIDVFVTLVGRYVRYFLGSDLLMRRVSFRVYST